MAEVRTDPSRTTAATWQMPAPAWATDHEPSDGGIRWTRTATVFAEPQHCDGEPDPVEVLAVASDELEVDGEHVYVQRDHAVQIFIGAWLFDVDQARRFAHAILGVVDAVEAGR